MALRRQRPVGSVAACDQGRLLAERKLAEGQRSANRWPLPCSSCWPKWAGKPRDVQRVAVTVGPGSFTGLRVGVTTAKTFAYAVGAAVIGIDTLEVIAAQAPDEAARVAVAARCPAAGSVCGRLWTETASHGRSLIEPARIVTFKPGSNRWPTTMGQRSGVGKAGGVLPPGGVRWRAQFWHPRAATVGRLAERGLRPRTA